MVYSGKSPVNVECDSFLDVLDVDKKSIEFQLTITLRFLTQTFLILPFRGSVSFDLSLH